MYAQSARSSSRAVRACIRMRVGERACVRKARAVCGAARVSACVHTRVCAQRDVCVCVFRYACACRHSRASACVGVCALDGASSAEPRPQLRRRCVAEERVARKLHECDHCANTHAHGRARTGTRLVLERDERVMESVERRCGLRLALSLEPLHRLQQSERSSWRRASALANIVDSVAVAAGFCTCKGLTGGEGRALTGAKHKP